MKQTPTEMIRELLPNSEYEIELRQMCERIWSKLDPGYFPEAVKHCNFLIDGTIRESIASCAAGPWEKGIENLEPNEFDKYLLTIRAEYEDEHDYIVVGTFSPACDWHEDRFDLCDGGSVGFDEITHHARINPPQEQEGAKKDADTIADANAQNAAARHPDEMRTE